MFASNGFRILDPDDSDEPIRELMTTSATTSNPTYPFTFLLSGMVPSATSLNGFTALFGNSGTTLSVMPNSMVTYMSSLGSPSYILWITIEEFIRRASKYYNTVLQVFNKVDSMLTIVSAQTYLDILFTFPEEILSTNDSEWKFTIFQSTTDSNRLNFSEAAIRAYYDARTKFNAGQI
jgi:hypothetical protein